VRRGPTNHGLVGRPRPGRGNKPVTAEFLGRNGKEIELTLTPNTQVEFF
jgi:hypothetical protein